MTEFQAAASKLREADAVLIGASNGLSITEGLHLFAANQAFRDLCGDFQDKYGISCLLQGMGAQWPEEEVKWAYWSRLVQHYCREYKKTPVMETLQALVGQKDYFIVTSNGECHFEKSGFDPKRIFEVEGTWLDLQCARACHNTLYPWEDLAGKMAAAETGGRIPTELVPHCPRCGGPMEVHLAMDSSFLPNTQGEEALKQFLQNWIGKKKVILELGIGPRNQLIKAPLMQLAALDPSITYITINRGQLYIPQEIASQAYGFDGLLEPVLQELLQA